MVPISSSSPKSVADRSDSFCHIHKNCLTHKVKANHSHKLSNYNHILKENVQTIAKDDHSHEILQYEWMENAIYINPCISKTPVAFWGNWRL